MDYKVEFMLDGEVKEDIVCLDDFNSLGSDFLEDFVKDQLIEKYESENIKIIHMETLIDYNVNVYDL